jgi:enterochelin esterase-like enzyme
VAFLSGEQIPPQQYVPVFVGELLPYVEANYRTLPQADRRASVGQGFGGFFAFACALGQPGLVGKVGTQGGFFSEFAWGPIQGMLKSAKEQPLDIYMDWGLYDLTSPVENWSVREVNVRAAEELRKRGYAPKGGEARDGAGWPSWRNRTAELLEALFPKAG